LAGEAGRSVQANWSDKTEDAWRYLGAATRPLRTERRGGQPAQAEDTLDAEEAGANDDDSGRRRFVTFLCSSLSSIFLVGYFLFRHVVSLFFVVLTCYAATDPVELFNGTAEFDGAENERSEN